MSGLVSRGRESCVSKDLITIVASLWIIIALALIMIISSTYMFAKSIKTNRQVIISNEELIQKIDSRDSDMKNNDNPIPISISDTDSKQNEVVNQISSSKSIQESSEVNLTSLKMVASRGASVENSVCNTVGDTFSRAIVAKDHNDAHCTFYLAGKYSKLSTDISVLDSSWVEEVPYSFEIYANNDENKVLYSTTLTRVTATQHVDLDVSDIEFITFRATYPGYGQYPTFIISDAILSRIK